MSTFNLFPTYEEVRLNIVKTKAGHAQNLPVSYCILNKSLVLIVTMQPILFSFQMMSPVLSSLTSTPAIIALQFFSSSLKMSACLQLRLSYLILLLPAMVFPQIFIWPNTLVFFHNRRYVLFILFLSVSLNKI